MAAIVPVVGLGPPTGGGPPEGVVAALKLSRPDDPLSVEALNREIDVFEALCRAPGEPPCPRLFDVILQPSPGLVMEWCPLDLERWWEQKHNQPGSLPEMFEALAAVCRRVREYAVVSEMELGRRVVHADIKPRNILISGTGRWLLTDFGAAKSRAVDDVGWEATRMIIGTENYIAPEALFNARKPHPSAMDTWSIGCTLFALLRMRTLLRSGAPLPSNGTHGHHFRTHRSAQVNDLQLRRPTVFADRELDASVFPTPDRLPDKDRAAVEEALAGSFSTPHLDARLITDVTNLLDRALQIDPARRYVDPIDMAGDLEALAARARELAVRSEGGATGPRASAPAVLPLGRAPPPRASGGGGVSLAWLLGGGFFAAVLIGGLLVTGAGLWWWLARTPPVEADGGTPALTEAGGPATPAIPAPPVPAAAPVGTPAPTPAPSPPPPAAKKDAPARAPEPPVERTAPPPPAIVEEEDPVEHDEPADLAASAPRGSGVLVVVGAEAYVVGKKGKRAPGTLPKGKYELFARIDGAWVSQGDVEVLEHETTSIRCGFGTCREVE